MGQTSLQLTIVCFRCQRTIARNLGNPIEFFRVALGITWSHNHGIVPAGQFTNLDLLLTPGSQHGHHLWTYTMIMAPGYAQSHPEELDRIAEIARYRPLTAEA